MQDALVATLYGDNPNSRFAEAYRILAGYPYPDQQFRF